MNQAELEKIVHEKCERVQREANLEVSRGTRTLLVTILALVAEDPHPSWREKGDPEHLQRTLVEALPLILLRAAKGIEGPRGLFRQSLWMEPLEKSMNTFDLLHRMSWITEFLCPFRKR